MSKIKVSYPFAILLAMLIIMDADNRLIITVCAAVIHELGHIFALIYKKIPFQSATIGITGANIIYGNERLTSYADDIFIALMGSCYNFIAIIYAFVAETILKNEMSFFIGCNALLGGFNLLPIIPLDGGRATESILAMKIGITEADGIMKIAGIGVGIAGVIAGLTFAAGKGNFTLLLVSVVILIKNINK